MRLDSVFMINNFCESFVVVFATYGHKYFTNLLKNEQSQLKIIIIRFSNKQQRG